MSVVLLQISGSTNVMELLQYLGNKVYSLTSQITLCHVFELKFPECYVD